MTTVGYHQFFICSMEISLFVEYFSEIGIVLFVELTDKTQHHILRFIGLWCVQVTRFEIYHRECV